MDFFEFVLIVLFAFVLPIVILTSALDYKKKKLEIERGAGEGLRLGELKALLAEVVREANEPLVERIDALDERRLPAHDPENDDEEFADRPAERTLGRPLG